MVFWDGQGSNDCRVGLTLPLELAETIRYARAQTHTHAHFLMHITVVYHILMLATSQVNNSNAALVLAGVVPLAQSSACAILLRRCSNYNEMVNLYMMTQSHSIHTVMGPAKLLI